MEQYINLLKDIVENGDHKESRTGEDTTSVFGRQLRFNLQDGFPLVTTKKCHLRSIIHELLWFIKGDTNIAYLNDNGVKIWDQWADEDGDLGPVYGAQWRDWSLPNETGEVAINGRIDQLKELIEGIKSRPHSRRHILSTWNPAVLPDESVSPQENVGLGLMALAPCHVLVQFNVRTTSLKTRLKRLADININVKDFGVNTHGFEQYISRLEKDNKLPTNHTLLDCQLYQRSCDVPLGGPFNIASYSLLTMMIADVCGLAYGDFVWTLGDTHIYDNQMDGVMEQVTRTPFKLPKMIINKKDDIESYSIYDFFLVGYESHEHIHYPIAV